MKIPLKHGYEAIIDDECEPLIEGWSIYTARHGTVIYADMYQLGTGRVTSLHRLVLGAVKGQIVCHLNGDGLDCRRANLAFGNHHLNAASHRHKRIKILIAIIEGEYE